MALMELLAKCLKQTHEVSVNKVAVGSNNSFGQKLFGVFKKKNKAANEDEYADADDHNMLQGQQNFAAEKMSGDGDLKVHIPGTAKKRNSEIHFNTGLQQSSDSKDKTGGSHSKESPDKKDHSYSVPKAATTVNNPFSFAPTSPTADEFDLLGGMSQQSGGVKTGAQGGDLPDLMTFEKPRSSPVSPALLERQPSPDRKQVISKKVVCSHSSKVMISTTSMT